MKQEISVIVPTLNLEKAIRNNIKILESEIKKLWPDYEIIIIDDASCDQTYQKAKKFASEKIKIFNFPQNYGKGFALKFGFYKSKGNLIVFIDGDLDLHPNQIKEFVKVLEENNCDIVIGSKRQKGSIVHYPWYRRFLSFCYQLLIKLFLNLTVKDTQVGLKLFKREVLVKCLPYVVIKRYAFDLELLAVASKLGYKIQEAPVNLQYQFSGSGINLKAVRNMLQDTLAVFYRLRLLKYYNQNLVPYHSGLKILILNWRDIKNPKSGGAEIVTHQLAKRWAKSGTFVALFTASFPGAKKQEEIDGVKIFRRGKQWTVHFWAWVYYKRYFQAKFDLIIDQINTVPFFTPWYAKREKIISFLHQLAREVWLYEFPFPLNRLGYLLEPLYLKIYRPYPSLIVSPSTRESLEKLKFDKNKIYLIKEGVNFKPLDNPPEKEKNPILIYLGRLNPSKRIEQIIEAFALVQEKHPLSKLYIVGRGNPHYQDKLKKLAKKLNLKNIIFSGYLAEEEKKELLKKAWTLVLTSVREGWGLVISEANALGTPAIVYKVPGLKDSVHDGINGLVCEKNNPQNLAAKIKEVIENQKLRETLIRNGLKLSQKFSWDASAQETLRIVNNLIDEPKL